MNIKKTKPLNILFTSVGKRIELIKAFREAYQSLHLDGKIIGTDINPLAPALQVVDSYRIVPEVQSKEYIPALIEICRNEQIDLIFPLIDPEIPLLSNNKELFEAIGVRLSVVSPDVSVICHDKWLMSEFFRSIKLTTPRSWLPSEINVDDLQFPLFIKPRDGNASLNVHRLNNKKELLFFVEYVRNPIIQEYIDGIEVTIDVICDLDGKILGIVPRQRLEVRSGEITKGVTIYHKDIIESCRLIAEKLPVIGPITIQCIIRDDLVCFTEINARFGGGVPLSIAAGVNSPQWLLAHAAGIEIEIPPIGTFTTGLYMTRYDSSFFLTDLIGIRAALQHPV